MAEKRVFISHWSAYEFWRAATGPKAATQTRTISLVAATARLSDVTERVGLQVLGDGDTLGAGLEELGISPHTLHVLVGADKHRKVGGRVAAHVARRPMPAGSFRLVADGVFVASPELTFFQMASELPFVDLLELGFELCGSYARAPDMPRGFVDRAPLTRVARIRAFVAKMRGRQGYKHAERAARYLCDGAASPAEAALVILLCLPSKLGGYELPLPRFNHVIRLSGRARTLTQREYLRGDLWWESAKLDVEYESTAHHANKRQLGVDSNRQIVLEAMGCHYVRVTRWQMENGREFESVVHSIRRALGRRDRPVGWRVQSNRWRLREYLIAPLACRKELHLT